jgi:hypothetical protein
MDLGAAGQWSSIRVTDGCMGEATTSFSPATKSSPTITFPTTARDHGEATDEPPGIRVA